MLYKFMKDGKQVNSAIADNEKEAIKINGGIAYDAIDVEPYLEVKTVTDTAGNAPHTQPDKLPRQTRKDKGQPHKKAETKTRNQPEYFVYSDTALSNALTHDEALEEIERCLPAAVRVIMGHEIKFTRRISFHIK